MKSVRIRAIRSLGGAVTIPAGTVFETNQKEAESLVNAGFAVYAADEDEVATATDPVAERRETTAARPRRKKRK